jgi:hypothetical protein
MSFLGRNAPNYDAKRPKMTRAITIVGTDATRDAPTQEEGFRRGDPCGYPALFSESIKTFFVGVDPRVHPERNWQRRTKAARRVLPQRK